MPNGKQLVNKDARFGEGNTEHLGIGNEKITIRCEVHGPPAVPLREDAASIQPT